MENPIFNKGKLTKVVLASLTGLMLAGYVSYSWFQSLTRGEQAAYAAKFALALTPNHPDLSRTMYEGLNRQFGSGDDTCGLSWVSDYLTNNPEQAWRDWNECDQDAGYIVDAYEEQIRSSFIDPAFGSFSYKRSAAEDALLFEAQKAIAKQYAGRLNLSNAMLGQEFVLYCMQADSSTDRNYQYATEALKYAHNTEVANSCISASLRILDTSSETVISSETYDQLLDTSSETVISSDTYDQLSKAQKILTFVQLISEKVPALNDTTYEQKLTVATNFLSELGHNSFIKESEYVNAFIQFFNESGINSWEMAMSLVNQNLMGAPDPSSLSRANENVADLASAGITIDSQGAHYYSFLSEYNAQGTTSINAVATRLSNETMFQAYSHEEISYLVFASGINYVYMPEVVITAVNKLNEIGIDDPYLVKVAFQNANSSMNSEPTDFLSAVTALATLLQLMSDTTLLSYGDILDLVRGDGNDFANSDYNVLWFLEELQDPQYGLTETEQVDIAIGIWNAVSLTAKYQELSFNSTDGAKAFLQRIISAFTARDRFPFSSTLTRTLTFEASRSILASTVMVQGSPHTFLDSYLNSLPTSGVATYQGHGTTMSMGNCASPTISETVHVISPVLTDYEGASLGLTMTRDSDGAVQFSISPYYQSTLNGRLMIGVDHNRRLVAIDMRDFASEVELRQYLAENFTSAFEPTMLIAETTDLDPAKLNYLFMSGYAIWINSESGEMGVVSFSENLTRAELPSFIEMLNLSGYTLLVPDYSASLVANNTFGSGSYYYPPTSNQLLLASAASCQ